MIPGYSHTNRRIKVPPAGFGIKVAYTFLGIDGLASPVRASWTGARHTVAFVANVENTMRAIVLNPTFV
jgi:hypothetical protein